MKVVYCDIDGNSISLEEHATLFANIDYRRVGDTNIGKYRISTVWIGAGHFLSDMFETIVFSGDSHAKKDYAGYNTKEEAQMGHTKMVYKWAEKCHMTATK